VSTERELKTAVRDWIAAQNGKVGPEDFDDDTPLFQQRIITSLQVLDLVLFIEEVTGHSIDVEQLKPGAFRSVNAIDANFGRQAAREG
jgi:acyl carrier protein